MGESGSNMINVAGLIWDTCGGKVGLDTAGGREGLETDEGWGGGGVGVYMLFSLGNLKKVKQKLV